MTSDTSPGSTPAAVAAAAPAADDHDAAHRVPYARIYWILVGALVVSLLFAFLEHHLLAASLIFAVAIVKAALVAGYYMHLKFEPRYVVLVVVAGIACLFILFGGLLLDIVHVYGD
ncbi:MAG TPA: cytochrome C oxidase subunit IV family protein [Candidatus Eisenbacteria bacterium]|nr:cytochrome C oxidase subunit IV family protein [Candidatus Eisenbacteria bacterium]